eukprot:1801845-Rhodomonas_salina.8
MIETRQSTDAQVRQGIAAGTYRVLWKLLEGALGVEGHDEVLDHEALAANTHAARCQFRGIAQRLQHQTGVERAPSG